MSSDALTQILAVITEQQQIADRFMQNAMSAIERKYGRPLLLTALRVVDARQERERVRAERSMDHPLSITAGRKRESAKRKAEREAQRVFREKR
jgi:hypothetical protein